MRDDILLPYPSVRERPARVLLTSDQALIRTALSLLLSANGMSVAGECSNDAAAIRELTVHADLVVIDLDLDSHIATRPETLGPLLGATAGLPVVILTRGADSRGISAALHHGALGVVLKNRPAEVLMRAIRSVMAGEVWLERSMVASFFVDDTLGPRNRSVLPERLTPRETQVVELVSLGLANKQIAERLAIAENTVRHHLTSIFDKLAVTNRVQLMRYTLDASATPQ